MYKWDKSFTVYKLVFTIGSISLTIESICHISFDPMVRVIDSMVKDLPHLCTNRLGHVYYDSWFRK
jgi:hypothetical protein